MTPRSLVLVVSGRRFSPFEAARGTGEQRPITTRTATLRVPAPEPAAGGLNGPWIGAPNMIRAETAEAVGSGPASVFGHPDEAVGAAATYGCARAIRGRSRPCPCRRATVTPNCLDGPDGCSRSGTVDNGVTIATVPPSDGRITFFWRPSVGVG